MLPSLTAVRASGFALAAINATGHGGPTQNHPRRAAGGRHQAAGRDRRADQLVHRRGPRRTRRAVGSRVGGQPWTHCSAPVGSWGVSLGSWIGVALSAAEPRIDAAVFGLAGDETIAKTAARVTVPIEFLLQWDDELVPRDPALALFDAFASREKTLHASPGPHMGVPWFELESSERFLTRRLVDGVAATAGG